MKSATIYEDQHYAACAMSDGSLVITCKRRKIGEPGYGVRVVGAAAVEWIAAIRTADDASEARALCRALVSPR